MAEAWAYRQTKLPHQTGNKMNELFPRAEAGKDPGDKDLWGELGDLERAGLEIARSRVKKERTKAKIEPQPGEAEASRENPKRS